MLNKKAHSFLVEQFVNIKFHLAELCLPDIACSFWHIDEHLGNTFSVSHLKRILFLIWDF
jgi:hypothetical protein